MTAGYEPDLTDYDIEQFLFDTIEPHAYRLCRACGHEFGDHVAGQCPQPGGPATSTEHQGE